MTDEKIGKTGLWLSIVGALLILIDGIVALTTGNLYIWSVTDAVTTGWVEIVLSILMFIAAPFYNKSPAGVGWTIFILALITLAFDGGFFWIGAILALAGGIMIAYKK